MASVKVAVRVRPFNERELSMESKCIIKMEGTKTTIWNDNMSSLSNKDFVYDASYWSFDQNDAHFASQLDVYNDLGRSTLTSAFDGYNACVCAYGQTGSGKSFSMMGHDGELEGLIPRICKNLFDRINSDKTHQTTYRCEVSYLEIYNEKVRDLLRSQDKGLSQNLKVREHPKTGVYVQDLSQHTVVTYDDIDELLNKGNRNRTVASTNMNDVSSRSHAIFTIKFSQAKIVENCPCETISKINLVDLAGSERADSTGATGIRLKEGGNINKSLLTFINVISTLADLSSQPGEQAKKHYIPYRDSVLTWLLKDSLGGNSKTVILAAISPADVNYGETLSTLRYANRAKNIINKPTINEDPNVKLIRELRAEIVRLKKLLDNSGISAEKTLLEIEEGVNETIVKQIDENQFKVDELTAQWKCKWSKYHEIFDEYENIELVKNDNNGLTLQSPKTAYLLCIDTNQNFLSLYPLKEGYNILNGLKQNFENDDFYDLPVNQIFLNEPEMEKKYCYFKLCLDQCWLHLLSKTSNLSFQVNGLDLTGSDIEIKNNDFLFIGKKIMFQYKNPNNLDDGRSFIDFYKNGSSEFEHELKNKLKQSEFIIDEQRKQIQTMNEQIELNNNEMNKLKQTKYLSPNALSPATTSLNSLCISDNEIKEAERQIISKELDEREAMQNILEKFEREERLLSDCMKDLNKQQHNQLKSLLFELQNLRLKEQELEQDLKRQKSEIEKSIEKLNDKREFKLSELNKSREKILQNKQLIDLKLKMSQLTNYEIDLDDKINELKESLGEDKLELERLNTQLSIKKMYSVEDGQKIEDLIQMEVNNLNRARDQLEKVKKTKLESYVIIENEFKIAKEQMVNNFENGQGMLVIKIELVELIDKETNLKKFLQNCLYENDEEKCLVENELSEIVELKEQLEQKIEQLRADNLSQIEKQMEQEYIGLDELKKQDLNEIRQDEERINLLYESSTKYLIDSIQSLNQQVIYKNTELKSLEMDANAQGKKMNQLLAELEVMENKRLIEENKIFLKELQIANEIKNEYEKLTGQISKLDSFYRKKLDETLIKKENMKPKICQIVGNYRGIQLFEADFSPKIQNQEPSPLRSHSSSLFTDISKQITIETDSAMSNGTSSPDSNPTSPNGLLIRSVRREVQEPRFQTTICKTLGIQIDINESYLFGKKSWDEHYEYLIEIRLNEDQWFIFRRYSKIRQLHEQMCLLYPSLNRLVFPMRLVFNIMDKQRLLERQLQLEHYLNCFMEILLNDPACPLCLDNFLNENKQVSNSISMTSLNSSIYSSSLVSTCSNGQLNLNTINRSLLCSFCPFFEQNQQDQAYASKLNIKPKNNIP